MYSHLSSSSWTLSTSLTCSHLSRSSQDLTWRYPALVPSLASLVSVISQPLSGHVMTQSHSPQNLPSPSVTHNSLSLPHPTPLLSPVSHPGQDQALRDLIIAVITYHDASMYCKMHICSGKTRIRMEEQCFCILICLLFTLNLTLFMSCMTWVFRTITIHFKYEYH